MYNNCILIYYYFIDKVAVNRQHMFSFQIWNLIVAPQHLQSEHIRDTWNKSIHDSLSKTMKLRVGVDFIKLNFTKRKSSLLVSYLANNKT